MSSPSPGNLYVGFDKLEGTEEVLPIDAVESMVEALEAGRREAKAFVKVVSRSLSVEESALSSTSERKAAKLRELDSEAAVCGRVPENDPEALKFDVEKAKTWNKMMNSRNQIVDKQISSVDLLDL